MINSKGEILHFLNIFLKKKLLNDISFREKNSQWCTNELNDHWGKPGPTNIVAIEGRKNLRYPILIIIVRIIP